MVQLLTFILSAAAVLAVIWIAVLTFEAIIDWFKSRAAKYRENMQNVAVTVKEGLRGGKHTVVQGIFNKGTETFVDGRIIQYEKMDEELKKTHAKSKLVVYE